MRRGTVAERRPALERFTPDSVESLRAVLSRCNIDRRPLRIEGGNTLAGMGAPAAADAILTTAALDSLIAHEQNDLTCAVQSGMRLASLETALAKAGQFIPLDAPLRKKATVGGTVAAGWLGPRRHLFGRPRDLLIGSQAVLADGTLVNAGGMVVKNVTGYDMSRLYAGSFGTLAVLTRLNFKTLALPAQRRALLARLPEATRMRTAGQLASLRMAPAATIFVEGFRKNVDGEDGIDGRVFVLLEGSSALLERATRDVRTALGRAGVPEAAVVDAGANEMLARIIDACAAPLGQRSITYRSLGTPESASDRAVAMRDAANLRRLFTDIICDANNGDVFVRVSDRDSRAFAEKIEACHDELRGIDARAAIVASDAPIRSNLDPWGAAPAAAGHMRKLKIRFDPNGILNPGRFVVR